MYSLSCNITIWTPAFIFYQDVTHKYVLWKTLIQGFTLCSDGLWNPSCSAYDFYEKKLRFPGHIRANVRRHAVWDSRCVRGISIKHLRILKSKTNFANVDTSLSTLCRNRPVIVWTSKKYTVVWLNHHFANYFPEGLSFKAMID